MKTNNLKNQSISHGTHRTQDLIPAFLDCLATYCPEQYEGFMVSPFPIMPAFVMDGGDSCWWWDTEDASILLEQLFDLLDEAAPDGYYFGAHPGDGSDFGFWACEEL